MSRPFLFLAGFLLIGAAPRPFHLQLESNTAATFPLLQRFGAIKIDVYPGGFRAKTIWLRGFSRNGSRTMTVENPVSRTYTDVALTDIGDMVHTLGGKKVDAPGPRDIEVTSGTVGHLAARRFRLIYSPGEYVDVWMTSALGPTPQYRAVADEFVRAVAPGTAASLRAIPGTPIYIEINLGPHRKVPVLRPTGVVFNRAGEAAALRVSPWMFPAPFGTIFQ